MSSKVTTDGKQKVTRQCLNEVFEKAGVNNVINTASASTSQIATAKQYSGRLEDLSVDTPSLINRDTLSPSLKKILRSRNGFDPRVWNPPKAARIRGTDEVFIYDGDHSRHLYKHFFPNRETMPVLVVEVGSREEVHELFVQANATGRTAMTAEQIFVHVFHAGRKDATKTEKILSEVGLKVYCSSEPGGQVGDLNGYLTKINGAKKAIKIVKKGEYGNCTLKAAVALLGRCMEASDKWNPDANFPAELLGGLTMLLGAYPALAPGNISHEHFEDRLSHDLKYHSAKQVAETYKSKGGAVVNHAEFSIAKGLVKTINESHSTYKLPKKLHGRKLSKFKPKKG